MGWLIDAALRSWEKALTPDPQVFPIDSFEALFSAMVAFTEQLRRSGVLVYEPSKPQQQAGD